MFSVTAEQVKDSCSFDIQGSEDWGKCGLAFGEPPTKSHPKGWATRGDAGWHRELSDTQHAIH